MITYYFISIESSSLKHKIVTKELNDFIEKQYVKLNQIFKNESIPSLEKLINENKIYQSIFNLKKIYNYIYFHGKIKEKIQKISDFYKAFENSGFPEIKTFENFFTNEDEIYSCNKFMNPIQYSRKDSNFICSGCKNKTSAYCLEIKLNNKIINKTQLLMSILIKNFINYFYFIDIKTYLKEQILKNKENSPNDDQINNNKINSIINEYIKNFYLNSKNLIDEIGFSNDNKTLTKKEIQEILEKYLFIEYINCQNSHPYLLREGKTIFTIHNLKENPNLIIKIKKQILRIKIVCLSIGIIIVLSIIGLIIYVKKKEKQTKTENKNPNILKLNLDNKDNNLNIPLINN